jgi:DNA-binding beta-propeller fold protein YncE
MTGSSIGRLSLTALAGVLIAVSASAQAVKKLDSYDGVEVRLLQSNNAGTVQHIIDPEINEVVGIIHGCPNPHNVTVGPDSKHYYCANELEETVDVFDTKSLELVTQIPLSARPNKVAINKKHRKAYVAIARRSANPGPGVTVDPNGRFPSLVDVIDIDTHTLVKSIEVFSVVHNVFVTPDENHVVAGLRGSVESGQPTIQVIDPVTDTVVRGLELTGYEQYGRTHHEVRPMAFLANEDGSTKWLFAQATAINRIWVLDWETGENVDFLVPPALPLWEKNADGIQTGDMHGLEVLPDKSAVWASSRLDSRIYGWSLPDLSFIGSVIVGPSANWMTATPDSKYMYVAVSGADHTLAIDLAKQQIVGKIKAGARPARIATAVLPPDRVNPHGTGMAEENE